MRPHSTFSTLTVLMIVLVLLAGAGLMPTTARGDIFIVNWNSGRASEYTNDGVPVNTSLVTGLTNPPTCVVAGSNLFVNNYGANKIGQYVLGSTPGTVTFSAPSLVTGLSQPRGIAVSGSTLYVASWTNTTDGKIGKYVLGATPGTLDSSTPSFISGLSGGPNAIAVNGTNVFVQNNLTGVIGEYDLTGAPVAPSLITVPNSQCLALSGSDLYVASYSGGTFTIGKYTLGATPGTIASFNPSLITGSGGPMAISVCGSSIYMDWYAGTRVMEYTTSGDLVNANLITGLSGADGIYVTPEPSSLALLGLSTAGLLLRRRKLGRQ
jgi:hypothetical protein